MASKRAFRRKSCEKKVRFTSDGSAWKSLRGHSKIGTMHVYRCKFCGGWHIGHPIGGFGQKELIR